MLRADQSDCRTHLMAFLHQLTSTVQRVAGDPRNGRRMQRRLGAIALTLFIPGGSSPPAAPTTPKPTGKEFQPAPTPITSALVTQGNTAATLVYSGNVQARST